jgi:hypothetical protein
MSFSLFTKLLFQSTTSLDKPRCLIYILSSSSRRTSFPPSRASVLDHARHLRPYSNRSTEWPKPYFDPKNSPILSNDQNAKYMRMIFCFCSGPTTPRQVNDRRRMKDHTQRTPLSEYLSRGTALRKTIRNDILISVSTSKAHLLHAPSENPSRQQKPETPEKVQMLGLPLPDINLPFS